MQLSKRLSAVAGFVTPGYKVADVGCDHAFTSIYLVANHISPQVIAMDVNLGPLERAKENIEKYKVEDRIIIRRSDGIKELEPGEVDSVILAGMGGILMTEILSVRKDIVSTLKEMILQPQSEISKVRRFVQDHGFLIMDENMIKEEGKYYFVMKTKLKSMVENPETFELREAVHFSFGRLLLERQNTLLLEYLLKELRTCEKIYDQLSLEQTENTESRKKDILSKIDLINNGLKYFNKGEMKIGGK
ncbi:MAG TPA: SAM-dependent methyltransferase [Clostridiales bacterium]|jgi:tRNA (adenine22-N1)-methyltransferase|nr:SAM-dependent methyltransferase [Clostridiales bacterium]